MNLETLLKRRYQWINNTGKFMGSLSVLKHEQYSYLPSFYRTLAWYDSQIANAYEAEQQETTFAVEKEKVLSIIN